MSCFYRDNCFVADALNKGFAECAKGIGGGEAVRRLEIVFVPFTDDDPGWQTNSNAACFHLRNGQGANSGAWRLARDWEQERFRRRRGSDKNNLDADGAAFSPRFLALILFSRPKICVANNKS